MKRFYNENDEIELRLAYNIGDHYFLEWRYKRPRKFWFLKIYDRWKSIHYYTPGVFNVEDDPNDDFFWYWHGFHLGRNSEVQEYEKIKDTVKTKKELFEYYHVKENTDLYFRNLHEHKLWLDRTKNTIEKLTKNEK